MRACPWCRRPVAGGRFCNHCGKPLAVAMPARNAPAGSGLSSTFGAMAIILGGAILLLVLSLVALMRGASSSTPPVAVSTPPVAVAPPAKVSRPSVAAGGVGYLSWEGRLKNGVWVASTEADWEPMLDAQNAPTDALVFRMAEAGRIRSYPINTKVLVLEAGALRSKIEVLESEFPNDVGRTGYVQAEFVAVAPGG